MIFQFAKHSWVVFQRYFA